MPNLTSVGITNGVPSSGTGTVSTIDALLAQLSSLYTTAQAMSAGFQLVSLPTDHGSVPTRASAETNTIYNGATALTPKFQKIVASSSGATTIVAAVTSKKIRVLAWDVVVNAAVNFKWQSHVTPTDLTGLYYNAGQGGGVARAFIPVGYFETIAGEALDINLSGAVAVGGVLTYVEV